jgi:hypothetical protein
LEAETVSTGSTLCGIFEADVQKLRQLSDNLISEFLALEEHGYRLASSICLFGCGTEAVEFVAAEMRSGLARRGHANVRVVVQGTKPRNDVESYFVDLAYFIMAARFDEGEGSNKAV